MEAKKENLKTALQSYADEIKSIMGKADAKKNDIKLKIDYKVIQKHERAEAIIDNLESWSSWYVFRRIKDAFRTVSWYTPDNCVDDIWAGIGKIKVTLSEDPTNSDKKDFEVKKYKHFDKCAKVILKLPLLVSGYSMCFDETELVNIIRLTAYQYQPDKTIELLAASATEYHVYWGWLSSFQRVIGMSDLFYDYNEDENVVKAKQALVTREEEYIRGWPAKIVRKSGFRRDGIVIVTTKNMWTCDTDGTNAVAHPLKDFVCCDVLPSGSKIPKLSGILSLRVYINEPPPEDPLTGCKAKCKCNVKMPKVNLPGIPLPKINLPKIDLPKIPMPSLPKIPMPDVPEMPTLFKIDISNPFKREKKVVPPRYHPDVKETNFTCILPPDDLSDDAEKKAFLLEISWVAFAAQSALNRTSNFEPYVEDYPGSDKPKAKQEVPLPGGGCCETM